MSGIPTGAGVAAEALPAPSAAPPSRGPDRTAPAGPAERREVVLVTGISGSGKSVALHALEDAGFFCVDNLPPELLRDFLGLEQSRPDRRIAIAVDGRSASSLPHLLPLLEQLGHEGFHILPLFLDASTDALVRRFSETRRPHPLSEARLHPLEALRAGDGADEVAGAAVRNPAAEGRSRRKDDHENQSRRALIDAIEYERELMAGLREVSTVLDTSQLRPAQLRIWMRDMVRARRNRLTLVFESFAFKHGVPLDADYVFDIRVLPNPHYVRELRPLTGRDADVAAYLAAQPEVGDMLAQIEAFLERWLPAFEADQRSYLTVAIGCTGGQHRSVYFAETLAAHFRSHAATLIRHRELDARG